uniref:Uncharacterized protein n=1 Tax=Anguilla anguilla TaxID=7936 RepID=A0A0E9SPV5_ANGAN
MSMPFCSSCDKVFIYFYFFTTTLVYPLNFDIPLLFVGNLGVDP